jgi:glucan biosynthesis protein C
MAAGEDEKVSRAETSLRLFFLDNIRYLMIVFVVVYHSVAAYATVAPWWGVHDGSFFAADIIRELFDVFMMPVIFFISGYFALPSLEKAGAKEFIKDKGIRLLIPWALGVFVVTPLILYDRPDQLVKPFWNYWLNWIGSFKTGLSSVPPFMPQTNQGVYWFVSLLFTFFVVFAVFHTVMRRWRSKTVPSASRKVTSGNSVLVTLMLFGVLTSVMYFLSLLFMPDLSWFTLSAFLQFEPTHLVLSVSYFALGVYAKSRGWFNEQKPLGSPAGWGAISAVLAIVFLVTVQPLYANPSVTPNLSVQLLAALAFIRSFLLLSTLVMLVSFGVRYWNRSANFDRQLSKTSYGIYLAHVWFVVIIQTSLVSIWAGGSPLAKFIIVFPVSLALSFAINRWLGRYKRPLAIALLILFVICLVIRP